MPEREAFANKFEEIKNEVNSTKVKNETINKYQEIAKELDKKLLINAIEKGQFQYYGSLEQKVQVSKYLSESLRNELVNASPEEQSEILEAVNYWEQTYNDLRNQSVEETLKERTEQELQALDLVLLLADAPVESVSEVALSKLHTLAGSVGEKILALFKAKPEVVKTIEEILGHGDDAYEIAKAGGKHKGQLEQFEKWTSKQLEKSIKSFEKNIADHSNWIQNPQIKISDWKNMSPDHQANMIHHWQNDILRAKELKLIAKKVLQYKK